MAVWQGAIRHGKGSMCSRCGQEATLEHVLWKCKWWTNHHPEPPEFERLRGQYPSLWLRGLGPPQNRPATYQQELVEEGVFQQRLVEQENLYFATDGSPGGSQDTRFQVLTWGVIAFIKGDNAIQVVGRATGPVSGEQTVFRAEAAALLYVARKTVGTVDVALDCISKKVRHPCQWREPSAPMMGEHSSHKMVNAGKMWLCCRCGIRQWIGRVDLFPSLGKQCRQVYTGNDQWIVNCIKKFAPQKAGFFKAPAKAQAKARCPVVPQPQTGEFPATAFYKPLPWC